MTIEFVLINLGVSYTPLARMVFKYRLNRPLLVSQQPRSSMSRSPPSIPIDIEEELVLVQFFRRLMRRKLDLPPCDQFAPKHTMTET